MVTAILPFSFLTCAGLFLQHVLLAPFWDRNASRLVGIFSLKYSLPLYTRIAEGPLVSSDYPPLSALVFAPVLLFNTPTPAILMGTVLNSLYFFSPVLLLIWTAPENFHRTRKEFLFVLTLVFGVSYLLTPLRYVAFRLHADAAALGFSAVAAIFLFQFIGANKRRSLVLSALFCVLAVWTKQTTFPILLALPLYLLFIGKRREGAIYFGWIMGIGALSVLFFALFFHLDAMLENIFFLRLFPFKGDPGTAILHSSREFLTGGYFFLPVAMVRIVSLVHAKDRARNPLSLLFFWLGLFTLPLSVVARSKVAADVNALALTMYFWMMGSVLALGEFSFDASPSKWRLAGRTVSMVVAVSFLLLMLPAMIRSGFTGPIHRAYQNPQQESYAYLLKHSEEIYFPWNPLSHLLAEKKLYHFDPAILDLYIAGRPILKGHFYKYLPKHMKFIAYHKNNDFNVKIVPELLKNYSVNEKFNELPDWMIYEENDTIADH